MTVKVVAVNLVGSTRPTTGVERYIQELLPRLLEQEPAGVRTLLVTESGRLAIPGVSTAQLEARRVRLPVPVSGSASRHLAIQLLVAPLLKRLGATCLYSPMNVPAVAWRRQVVVLHDLSWKRFPNAYRHGYRAVHAGLLHAVRWRRFPVIAVSEAVAGELRRVLPHNRVSVVHSGPGMTISGCAKVVRDGPRNRVLWVGTMQPRKGLADAINACAGAARRLGRRLSLVAAGGTGTSFRGQPLPQFPEVDLKLIGRPSDEELDRLYHESDLLLFTSRYEGFGFPVYEALVRELPVVSTDLPPLREFPLTGASLVPIGDLEALGAAVAEELARALPSRTTPPPVSWELCATQTWAEICRVAAEDCP